MLETKFTGGDWHVGCLGGDGKCQCTFILNEGICGAIATIHIDNELPISEGGNDAPPREEAIGNIHLIGAAPKLFWACVEAQARLRYSGDLFHDQGLQSRAEADWRAAALCQAAIDLAMNVEPLQVDDHVPESVEEQGALWASTRDAIQQWADREFVSYRRTRNVLVTYAEEVAAIAVKQVLSGLVAEIDRLMPHYQSDSHIDAGRRQMLEHLKKLHGGDA